VACERVEDKLITLPNDRGKSIQSATRFLTEPRVSYAAVEFDLWRFSVGRIFNLLSARDLVEKRRRIRFRCFALAQSEVKLIFGTCAALINRFEGAHE
jgi:hypothetical protein